MTTVISDDNIRCQPPDDNSRWQPPDYNRHLRWQHQMTTPRWQPLPDNPDDNSRWQLQMTTPRWQPPNNNPQMTTVISDDNLDDKPQMSCQLQSRLSSGCCHAGSHPGRHLDVVI
jgi:hypothetical protein